MNKLTAAQQAEIDSIKASFNYDPDIEFGPSADDLEIMMSDYLYEMEADFDKAYKDAVVGHRRRPGVDEESYLDACSDFAADFYSDLTDEKARHAKLEAMIKARNAADRATYARLMGQ